MNDRLISANALKELIANHIYPVADAFNNRDYGMFWTGGIEKAIDDAPAVDAVEVVRCEDCKWFRFHKTAVWCENDGGLNYPQYNSFCSKGERKEDETIYG